MPRQPTGNIIVHFKATEIEEEIKKILSSNGLYIVYQLTYAENLYVARQAKHRDLTLETLDKLDADELNKIVKKLSQAMGCLSAEIEWLERIGPRDKEGEE